MFLSSQYILLDCRVDSAEKSNQEAVGVVLLLLLLLSYDDLMDKPVLISAAQYNIKLYWS